ncbi:hypothetical protein [Jatrophihabitans fulvus]
MKPRTALLTAVLTALAAVLLTAGCSSAVPGRPSADPPPELTAPAGQVVFQVTAAGGYVPSDYRTASRPAVTVYGDGRAFVLDPTPRRSWSGQPVQLQRGTVDRAALRDLVADAHRSGLFDDVDFGDPRITDLGTTAVTFRPGAAPAAKASAYALGYEDDDVTGLDDRQRLLRAELRRFIGRLQDGVTGATAWRPDRVDVRVAEGEPDGSPRPWPGPDLSRVLGNVRTNGGPVCGVLTGDDAGRVFTAARDSGDITWTDGARTVALVVRALLPGEPACG